MSGYVIEVWSGGSGVLFVHFGGVALKHATRLILAVNPQIIRASLIRQSSVLRKQSMPSIN